MARSPAQPNRSVIDALTILQEVVGRAGPVSTTELAGELGLDKTRVSRLLGTLAAIGLAQRTSDRRYTAGAGVHVLAAMALRRSALLRSALWHLRTLIERTGLLAAMGVRWRRHVCYLYHGGPDRPAQAAIAGHDLHPAERSSIGLVLLSREDPRDVRELYAGRPLHHARLGTVEELLAHLDEVRADGFAVGGFTEDEDRSVAVGIGSPPVAALALAGRYTKRQIPAMVARLREAADRIAESIGKDLTC